MAQKAADRCKGLVGWWLRRFLLLLILAQVLAAASVLPETQFDMQLYPFLDGRRFDWVGWEINAIWQEGEWWLQGQPLPGNPDSQKAEVLGFLARQQQDRQPPCARLHVCVPLGCPPSGAGGHENRGLPPPCENRGLPPPCENRGLPQAEAARRVERIVAAQVGSALADQGLGSGDGVWPPVTFRFDDLPAYLIISPRREIRLYRGIHLLPDTSEAERISVEAAIEADLDVSALVDDLGGIGSWPTMVARIESLPDLLDVVAHEWVHTYLFFQPLGMQYDASRDLTTMNETVASIIGEEVAERVITDSYPEFVAPAAPEDSGAGASGAQPDEFSLAMRRIRVHVDDLLAAGRVTEAESYMEAERQKMTAEGYTLRRLNQAYFAFHGSYATSSASVDPIGAWMRQLRAQSGSLKRFLEQAAQMQSLDDLLHALGKDSNTSQRSWGLMGL